jgi:putative methylase
LKLKKLAMLLESLDAHPSPAPRLEQYTITGEDAARFLWRVRSWLRGSIVVDLGCGTGRLAIGAALLGASFVLGVDVDQVALSIAKSNAKRAGVEHVTSWLRASIPHLSIRGEVVVQNPPFGVQRRGADRAFIQCALNTAPLSFSLHKRTLKSQLFIKRLVEELGGAAEVLDSLQLKLPYTFPFHEKRFKLVEVDLYLFKGKAFRIPRS